MVSSEREMMAAMGLPTSFLKSSGPAVASSIAVTSDEKMCKYCECSYPRIMFAPSQWQKKKATCYGCAEKGSFRKKRPREEVELAAAKAQLEFYFSDQNWRKDSYLKNLADDDGFVSLKEILEFPRLKAMLPPENAFEAAKSCVEASETLIMRGEKVGRDRSNSFQKPILCGLQVDDQETRRRKDRANRFSSKGQEKNTDHLEYCEDEEDDEFLSSPESVVGKCRVLEKSYFRLTSAPLAENVRPPEILKLALEKVSSKYYEDEDYSYARDQLKAIRQDLTVQNISGSLACEVYETCARISLAEGDLAEFGQCQSRLVEVHAKYSSPSRHEFMAYGLLYALTQQRNSLASVRAFADVIKEQTLSESVFLDFAVNVARALNLDDYSALFRLYANAPGAAAAFLEKLLPKLQAKAYTICRKAFRPTLSLARLSTFIGFTDANDCRTYLQTLHGAQFDTHDNLIIKN